MKIRPARGMGTTLDESMQEMSEVNTHAELLVYLQTHYDFWEPTEQNVTIKPYGYDTRNAWHTHIICVDGNAALFSDGPLPD